MPKNKRKGKGVYFANTTETGFGTREISGFFIDNLDTKAFSEAENNYEKVFILVREALENNGSFCMDVEKERLQCCQDIADLLKSSRLVPQGK